MHLNVVTEYPPFPLILADYFPIHHPHIMPPLYNANFYKIPKFALYRGSTV